MGFERDATSDGVGIERHPRGCKPITGTSERPKARAGAGDSNGVKRRSAPVNDGVGEVGAYARSFRATCSTRHSQ